MTERISIAMATYNGARFIREQLDSLYNQTRVPDEIIVCDDGSTDGTIDILEEYHRKHNLTYYVNESNVGVNVNFINVFSKCTGDYVFICDQDDIWFPDKIEKHYEIIRNTDKTIPIAVSSSRTDVDANGVEIAEPIVKEYSDSWADTLISTSNSQGCTMLMNRCLVNKVLELHKTTAESRKMMYDVLVSVTAASCGKKINTGIPLMYYRHHDANVIDKFREKKKTFVDKVKEMPLYYPFLMDYRIKELALTSQMLRNQDMQDDIRIFLLKMSELNSTHNILKGISIICSLPNISKSRKFKVLLLTPIVYVLKYILR